MTPTRLLLVIALVCFVVSSYGIAISNGPDSLGWNLRMFFGSVGAIAVIALFLIWFFSSDRVQ